METVAKSPGIKAITDLHWADFERLVSEYYRRKGFQVSRRGGNGPDGGIDLVLRQKNESYLVQCKQWRAYKVGVQPVREFYGVMAAERVAGGYFVTSGEYTEEAKRFAHGLNLELIDGAKLRQMIALVQQPPMQRAKPDPLPSPTPGLGAAASVLPSVTSAASMSPRCPKCQAEMSKRVGRQGPNMGKEFWGCTKYPRCKGTVAIDDAPSVKSAPEPVVENQVEQKKVCPDCGTALVVKEFMSGPRNGQQFLACLPCKKGWSLGHAG